MQRSVREELMAVLCHLDTSHGDLKDYNATFEV